MLDLTTGKILFWEKHYFRIIASLRRYRYKIPISFTMEKLEGELIKVTNKIDSKIKTVYLDANSLRLIMKQNSL